MLIASPNQPTEPVDGVISVLLVGPPNSGYCLLRNIFTAPQWHFREVSSYRTAIRTLNDVSIGVVICDAKIQNRGWHDLLANLQRRSHPPQLIVSSRLADERLWAEVLNLGGYDVLVQPFDRAEVLRVAHMAWRAAQHNDPADAPAALRMSAAS